MFFKEFWKSKTFWATLITGLLGIYNGLSADGIVPPIPEQTLAAILVVLGGLGLYGRAVANTKLKLK